jgi:acyl-CoA synthetase (AMP-forming)/AMP-acid ligase II
VVKQLATELTSRAATDPDTVAVIDADGQHTLGEVVTEASRLAAWLEEAVGGSPTVLVQADNSWRTLAAAVAVGLRGGLIAVTSRQATASEVALALEDLRPDVVVAADDVLAGWRLPREFAVSGTALAGWRTRAKQPPASDVTRWGGGSVVAMTSGSTGRPKCVVQSEDALRYAGSCTVEAVGLRAGDPVAALVPLSSVAAFCFGMYLPASLGAPMVCLDKWSPQKALELMEQHRVSWTMLVPTMALQLAVQPGAEGALTSLKAMTVGGGPMDAGALQRAETVLGTRILRVFGMSECLGHTTPRPDEPWEIRLGRDGRPFPGTVVRAVDADGNELPPGTVGEAQVRGPSLFVGYARDGRVERPRFTADGFLPTGDLVEVGHDGTIKVSGRKKQIIIRGGRNIDINEVEAAVGRMPGINQVCVVPVPDDVLGERVAALVVAEGGTLGLSEVTRWLEESGFPKQKWPEYVFTVPELPRNRVGKLSRPDATALAVRLRDSDPSSGQTS